MSSFPSSPRLLKGAIVGLDPFNPLTSVAIGLVFVYLLPSLVVTAGTELIASWLNWRAENLRKGLERMLDPALAQDLYDHPLIKKLSKSGRRPSYIPSGTFALALVDVIANLNEGGSAASQRL